MSFFKITISIDVSMSRLVVVFRFHRFLLTCTKSAYVQTNYQPNSAQLVKPKKYSWGYNSLGRHLWSPDTSKWVTFRIPCVSCTNTCLILSDTYQKSIGSLNFNFFKNIFPIPFPICIGRVSDNINFIF